jgi:hypothetical protein
MGTRPWSCCPLLREEQKTFARVELSALDDPFET